MCQTFDAINVKNIQKGGILNAYKGTYEEVVNQGKREVEKKVLCHK